MERRSAVTGIAIAIFIVCFLLLCHLYLEHTFYSLKLLHTYTPIFILGTATNPPHTHKPTNKHTAKKKPSRRIELAVFRGKEAKLNRIIFIILDSKKLLTTYDMYLEIRRIKGYRHTKRQSVDRRMKALHQQGWLNKNGVRPAKAHFLSPLYMLSIRAHVALVVDKTDMDGFIQTAPEPNLQMFLHAVTICQ
jgi:hypothetical protein